jgi:hypothetical protein
MITKHKFKRERLMFFKEVLIHEYPIICSVDFRDIAIRLRSDEARVIRAYATPQNSRDAAQNTP